MYVYTDLTPEMEITWDKDVNFSIDARAVKNSIKGIITTRKGDRPFMPEFGCDLPGQLFETMNPLVLSTMRINIIDAIRNFEPRVEDLRVLVTPEYDRNTVIVDLKYSIIDNPDRVEELKLELSKNRI